MRILLLSFFFPPYNSIAAARTGKIARYLFEAGHDVRVISARKQRRLPTPITLEIPEERVIYTPWFDYSRYIELVQFRSINAPPPQPSTPQPAQTSRPRMPLWRKIGSELRGKLRTLAYYPDEYITWIPTAYRASMQLLKTWQPDIIYASAPPPSVLITASMVARRQAIPWVAEFRDLWTDNHDYQYIYLRRRFEERLEARTLASANGLVTVSQTWADLLTHKYHRDVAVVTNGFDPSDYPQNVQVPYRDGTLRIVYTGTVYLGSQSPAPLFDALQRMGQNAEAVRVAFYGSKAALIREEAARYQVEHLVEIYDHVSYRQSLEVQCQADILLFLTWNDKRVRGWFSGKLYEYLGARRPILAVGSYTEDVSTELIRNRQAGVVLSDSDAIAAQLRAWINEKRTTGSIASLPDHVTVGITRKEQTQVLERYLTGLLDAGMKV